MIIKQAVILCGGRGKRLKPLTDNLPKPMVLVNDSPFLLYLILYLKKFGIKNFLLLTGYKSESLKKYFKNGRHLNVRIDYSYMPTSTNTSKRVFKAKNILNKDFLLLYSDNFIDFNFETLLNNYIKYSPTISLLIKRKNPGNVKFNYLSSSYEYHKKRHIDNKFVELGFMLINKYKLFKIINNKNISFNNIIELASDRKEISAIELKNSYYSIGDIARLTKMKKFLKLKKIIFIDRDGVINQKPKKGTYITKWKNFKFINDTIKSMKYLSSIGFKFIIITNQAGLARGMITKTNYDKILLNLKKYFISEKISLLNIYTCPHHWDKICNCRKPEPGLFFKASNRYSIRLSNTIFIGDQISDYNAAKNSYTYPLIITNKSEIIKTLKTNKFSHYAKKVSDLIPIIKKFYENK